jgi:hypothetical protein
MSEGSYENIQPEDAASSSGGDTNNFTTTEEQEDEVVISRRQDEPLAEEEEARSSHREQPIWEDDGSDGAWVRHVIEELLLWKYPVHSALWLIVFSLVYFLVKVSEYSLLTLACYLILLQLIATTAAIRGAPVLKSMNLLRGNFDAKTFALQRQAFSAEELFRFSRGCAEIASGWILEWNDTLVTRNAKKVLRVTGAFFALAIIGLIIPLDIMLIVFVVLAFSLLKIYDMQRAKADEIIEVLHERYDEKVAPWLQKIYPFLDSVLYRLEPILGRFDD